MIIRDKQVKELREALETVQRPLFFYDDDPDGLASFLLFYRFVKEGKGVLVKTTATLTKQWKRKVEEYNPDSIFILDVPNVDQDFLDGLTVPVYWVDHHMPVERHNVKYYNPRVHKKDAYIPTTRVCYEVVQQDAWIAGVGCVADWYVPDFKEKLAQEYPDLMKEDVGDPEVALFNTPIGELARIFSFTLKGKNNDVLKCIKIMTRIEHPDELLHGTTSQGKFVKKRFEKIHVRYEDLIKKASKTKGKDGFLVFMYDEDQWSFTSDLSNELSYKFPEHVIIVCREKNGEYKCSLRARLKPLLPAVKEALQGIKGRGGGHEQACGAVIAAEDFDQFLTALKHAY